MEFDAVINLLEYVFFGRTIAWHEGVVEAVGAAARAHRAVTVGTAETGIDGQFQYRLPELVL